MDTYVGVVITDIHGYMNSLSAILRSIKKVEKEMKGKVNKIICLGDMVGYGPNPLACLDWARKNADIYLPGNHEEILRVLFLYPNKRIDFIKEGINENAIVSAECTIDELIGEKTMNIFGRKVTFPLEKFQDIQKPEYSYLVAKQIIGKYLPNFDIDSPNTKLLSRSISETAKKHIGFKYLLQALTRYPHLFGEYRQRILRGEKVKDIYNFLDGIKKEKTFRLKNALFVHDDPIEPGSQKYLVTDEIAEDLEIAIGYRIFTSRINKKNFQGIDHVLVGHSHADAETAEMNQIDVTFCGGGMPRTNKGPKRPSYVFFSVNKNRLTNVVPIMVGEEPK